MKLYDIHIESIENGVIVTVQYIDDADGIIDKHYAFNKIGVTCSTNSLLGFIQDLLENEGKE